MCMSNALYCVDGLRSVAILVQAACVHLRNGVLEQNGYKIYSHPPTTFPSGTSPTPPPLRPYPAKPCAGCLAGDGCAYTGICEPVRPFFGPDTSGARRAGPQVPPQEVLGRTDRLPTVVGLRNISSLSGDLPEDRREGC